MVNLVEIGVIHSPFEKRSDVPKNGSDEVFEIEIYEKYEEGLKDIEGFSHIHVFYWLHRSDASPLSVNTPWDTEPHGVFSTRSPDRPNSIGHSVVELLKVKGRFLEVRGLDAIEGTPVLDLKPYFSSSDSVQDASRGWFGKG